MRKAIVGVSLLAFLAFAQTPALPEGVALPNGVTTELNLAYDQYPETKIDVFKPKGWSADGKHPGVLVIHGGGWTGGTKESMVQRWVLPYVNKGFVAANVEYRLAKAKTAPAAVEDVMKAAQWFQSNARRLGVDSRRIVVTGGSAGGHLSLMVGMAQKKAKLGSPSRIAAIVNFYGITDVADQLSGPHMREYAVTWVPEQEGRLDLAARVSPMTYVRKDVPPILTIHGDQDQTVPYIHGTKLTKALSDIGADAQLITVPGGKHGQPQADFDAVYPQIFDFLAKRGILK